jgi:hypothetical protein
MYRASNKVRWFQKVSHRHTTIKQNTAHASVPSQGFGMLKNQQVLLTLLVKHMIPWCQLATKEQQCEHEMARTQQSTIQTMTQAHANLPNHYFETNAERQLFENLNNHGR